MSWKIAQFRRNLVQASVLRPEYMEPVSQGTKNVPLATYFSKVNSITDYFYDLQLGQSVCFAQTSERKMWGTVASRSTTQYYRQTVVYVTVNLAITDMQNNLIWDFGNTGTPVLILSVAGEKMPNAYSVIFDSETGHADIVFCNEQSYQTNIQSDFRYRMNNQTNRETFYAALGNIQELDDDPYSIGGTSTIGGGDGYLDISSDTIPIPDLPVQSAVGSGFVQVYAPTSAQLGSLAAFLWSTSFLDSLVKLKNDPFDIIVSLSLMPFAVPVDPVTKNLKAGNVDTLIAMNVASSQFVDVDCGTFTVQPFYDAYLDFDPFTKCELFLPYHGVQELSLDDIMGKTIGIKYRVDILTGSYICYVTLDGSVFYTYTGTCGLEIPITGQDYSALYSSLINLATSAAVAGVAGAPVMAGGGEAAAAARVGYISGQGANAISTGISALTMKPTISRSGSLSSNIGSLGPQIPYLIFKVPRVSLPKNSMKLTGYPLNATAKLSELRGFTQIQDIKFSGMTCTERELSEIDSLLKAGIYIESNVITPVTDAHTVALYTNGSHPSVINKSLTLIDSVTGELRENQQLSDVQLTLNRSSYTGSIPNYIYISDLHRYYFVEDVTIINSELIALTCHVDLLQSFADEILSQTAVISKQENNWNLYLNDGTFKCYQNPYVIQKLFPAGFNTAAMTYVLTVTGGGETV